MDVANVWITVAVVLLAMERIYDVLVHRELLLRRVKRIEEQISVGERK